MITFIKRQKYILNKNYVDSMDQEKKIQFKKNLQIFLMIFIPYVCFLSFRAYLEYLVNWGSHEILGIISELFGYLINPTNFRLMGSNANIVITNAILGVCLILFISMMNIKIRLKDQKNTQFTNGKNIEDVSEKISPEPIVYRISIAGKDIKFSLILSIIILILDILLFFTLSNADNLWGFTVNTTTAIKGFISYIMISISIILAIISIWFSLKPREQEKGKNLFLFGIQYLIFLVFLFLTYWRYNNLNVGIKSWQISQSLFLVILIVSCLGIGFSLLSGSKKDQLNILFFTFYFTLGNFVFFFGFAAYFMRQFVIVSILSGVIGFIVVKYRNTSKIKIGLPIILYGLFISGSSFDFSYFIFMASAFSSYGIPFYFVFIGIAFIVIQIMTLIQLLINSNNLNEELRNNNNYIKMLYFIELIVIFPTWMHGLSFYNISILILVIINFGLLLMQHRFKINIYLGALLLNLIVFIPNILIRLLSNWTYESVYSSFVLYQQFYIVFMGILTSITLAIPLIKENRDKKKNLVEK